MSLRQKRKIAEVPKTDEDVKTEEKSLFDELNKLAGQREIVNVLLTNKVFMKYLEIMDFLEEKAYIDLSVVQSEQSSNVIRGKLNLLGTIRQLMAVINQSKGA